MANNKAFIFKSLEALEAHGKIKEIHWLSESYFCEEKFKISWKDEIGRTLPVLKILYPQLDKETERKSKTDKDVYYKDKIVLDGIPFLVFNKWFEDSQTLFLEWLKSVLGNNFSELSEIENSLKAKGEN